MLGGSSIPWCELNPTGWILSLQGYSNGLHLEYPRSSRLQSCRQQKLAEFLAFPLRGNHARLQLLAQLTLPSIQNPSKISKSFIYMYEPRARRPFGTRFPRPNSASMPNHSPVIVFPVIDRFYCSKLMARLKSKMWGSGAWIS